MLELFVSRRFDAETGLASRLRPYQESTVQKIVPAAELADHVGSEIGLSEWFEISQERVNAFADATLDHQFIHVDPEAAAQTPFGGTIAHGYLTLSLLPHLSADIGLIPENVVMGVNYGSDKIRFLNPVRVGSRVRARMVLSAVKEKGPGQYLLTSRVTIEIDGIEKPAMIADVLTMLVTG